MKSPCCEVVGRNRQNDETNEIRRRRRLEAGSKWNLVETKAGRCAESERSKPVGPFGAWGDVGAKEGWR